MFISHYNGHEIKLVRLLSTVDNTRDYARVSHSRQWSNYNIYQAEVVKMRDTLRLMDEPVRAWDLWTDLFNASWRIHHSTRHYAL